VDSVAEVLRAQLGLLMELDARRDEVMARVLEVARGLECSDREGGEVLLEVAEAAGRCGQAGQGQLVLLLAQADRVRAARGGVKAWAATHLDVTDGRAREIAQAARRIGNVPELAEPLATGRIGSGTISVLSRTARAINGTDRDKTATLTAMLDTARSEGITQAGKQVRVLEHTLSPGSSEENLTRQRARSFYRVIELGDGLCRFEILLDAMRATVLRCAVDQQAAEWIRTAQFDGTPVLPEDVRTVEQINAQAITRLAEVFLDAPAEVRGAHFTPSVLIFAPADQPLAQTVYGETVPSGAIDPTTAQVLEVAEDGQPVALDGVKIDTDPHARHASRQQRTALAYRDRHCTYPGCTRPSTWSLHAHHQTPYSKSGPTVMRNLALLCPEHHTLTHQGQHDDAQR
jgi:HNH endonuclease